MSEKPFCRLKTTQAALSVDKINWNKVDDDNETTLSGGAKDDLKGESGKPDSRANDLALVQSNNASPSQLQQGKAGQSDN